MYVSALCKDVWRHRLERLTSEVTHRLLRPYDEATKLDILIAEDAQSTLTMMSTMLSQLGHHVIATADGAEVVAAAAREAYAVILTDMRMPKLTGLEVIKTLRSRGDHTPIIVFSSDEDRGVANECIEAGAEAIIRKPVDYEKLLALLDQVAAKR